MKTFILLFLIFSFHSVYSQHPKSYFYNEKGQFLLDTTLTISKEQYEKWWREEFNLLEAFSHINYPQIYVDNPYQPVDPIIVSFTIDLNNVKEVTVLNEAPAFTEAIKKGIKQHEGRIAYLLSPSKEEKYYIAISFILVNFYEKLKEEGAVPIIEGSQPLISTKMPPLKAAPLKE